MGAGMKPNLSQIGMGKEISVSPVTDQVWGTRRESDTVLVFLGPVCEGSRGFHREWLKKKKKKWSAWSLKAKFSALCLQFQVPATRGTITFWSPSWQWIAASNKNQWNPSLLLFKQYSLKYQKQYQHSFFYLHPTIVLNHDLPWSNSEYLRQKPRSLIVNENSLS